MRRTSYGSANMKPAKSAASILRPKHSRNSRFPAVGATPYALMIDKNTGHVWFSSMEWTPSPKWTPQRARSRSTRFCSPKTGMRDFFQGCRWAHVVRFSGETIELRYFYLAGSSTSQRAGGRRSEGREVIDRKRRAPQGTGRCAISQQIGGKFFYSRDKSIVIVSLRRLPSSKYTIYCEFVAIMPSSFVFPRNLIFSGDKKARTAPRSAPFSQ